MKKNAPLPKIPSAIEVQYSPALVKKVKTLAQQWRDDEIEQDRTFTTPTAFYQALVLQLTAQSQTTTQDQAPAQGQWTKPPALWDKLKAAVDTPGDVTEIPWSSFSQDESTALATELMRCEVQISGNAKTTACHANLHEKLPKKVENAKTLADLPASEQPDHTPYIEFLITGHKKTTGIERGIIDRESGAIYLTAHYTKGSFALLSGAPGNLVQDWQAKATGYCRVLKT
jgi:hypothetical protein